MKDEEFRSLYRHLVEYEDPPVQAKKEILKNLLGVLADEKKATGKSV